MAAYYKVEVTLNSQAVQVGLPSPQSVRVTLPLVGPQGPQGPQGEPGPPGEVSGTIVWDNVTEKPSTFPPSAHTHVAADITDFTTAVEAVSPPADWDTLSNKPATFTPSLHGSTHHTGGTDAIAPENIGAQSIFTTETLTINGAVTLTAARAKTYSVIVNGNSTITLPTTGHLVGDIVVIRYTTGTSSLNVTWTAGGQSITLGQQYRFIATGTSAINWQVVPVDTHTHTASQVTDFNTAAAAAAPVQSVNGNTGTVTVAVPSASTATPQALGTAAAGTSDDYSRADHIHAAPALNDLSNVSAATPSDNDVLVFDTATSTWVAGAPSGGGPSGATNLWIPASAWIPRTTAGCGVDSREIGSTNRQNFDELLFDAGTDEFAQALVIMPSNYNNSTITARFYWTAASGSGDVIWGIQGRAFANDDALDTAHGTAQTATDTLLAADDMHVSAATSAVTIGGTPAANTPIQFQVYRDADAGGDTLAVDARLLGVEIIFN